MTKRHIRLLAFDGFDELGMRDDDMEVLFKDVVNGEPILADGLHADIRAMILLEPGCEFAQISRIGREALTLIHYFDGTALGFIPRWCRKGMVII